MPNWCGNKVTFTGSPDLINQVIEKAQTGLFNGFVPMPTALLDAEAPNTPEAVASANMAEFSFPNWYAFAHEKWGTKWDVQGQDVQVFNHENLAIDKSRVSLRFDTAWTPPVRFFEALSELGLTVEAFYAEEGMGFAGCYTTEKGDSVVEYTQDEEKLIVLRGDKDLFPKIADEMGLVPEEYDD